MIKVAPLCNIHENAGDTRSFLLSPLLRHVFTMQVEPPFIPKVQGSGDTSNFESYPESAEDDTPPLSAEEEAMFQDLDKF